MNSSTTAPPRQQVLVFRELPPDQLARLQAVHDVTVANPRVPEQAAAFLSALATTQGMIGSSYPVDAALLERSQMMVHQLASSSEYAVFSGNGALLQQDVDATLAGCSG